MAASGLIAPAAGWDSRLTVVVPARAEAFPSAAGLPDGDAAAGTECRTGTARVVVNPVVLDLDDAYLDVLLVHEAVHVATGSACSGGGTGWAVEGIAEAVAAGSDPALAEANAALVRQHLAEHGVPDELPTGLFDQTDYALAQVVVDQLAAHLDRAAAVDLLDRAIRSPDRLTGAELADLRSWYRAELARLAESA